MALSCNTHPNSPARAEIAAAASGKGGGFLAAGWGDGGPTEPLHRTSFALHEELADALGLTSFRRLPTLSVRPKPVSPMERLVLRNRLRQRGVVSKDNFRRCSRRHQA